jgi:hypothetical protein
MKLSYTDINGRKQVYPHEFASVREALHVAANTGYILDAKELHIADAPEKKGAGKPPKGTVGADGGGGTDGTDDGEAA